MPVAAEPAVTADRLRPAARFLPSCRRRPTGRSSRRTRARTRCPTMWPRARRPTRRCRSRSVRRHPPRSRIASGVTPKPNASEVMMIGRNRNLAASIVASNTPLPASCRSLANSTIRIAFFDASPIVVSRPTWKKHVVGQPEERSSGQRTGHAQRDHQKHRERDRPTLVQRGQAQEHYQDRDAEQQRPLRSGLLLLVGDPGPLVADARRELGDDVSGRGDRDPSAEARCRLAQKLDGGNTIIALQPR